MRGTIPPGVRGLLRSLGALAVALAFVSVLMTASAQQEVMRHLAVADPDLDYSSAYVVKLRVDRMDDDAHLALAAERFAAAALAEARGAQARAASSFDAAWNGIEPVVRRAAAACGIAAIADVPDPAPRWQALGAVVACRADGRLSAVEAARFDAAASPRAAVTRAYRGWTPIAGRLAVAEARLADAQARTRALASGSAAARRVADSFDATSKLRSSWFLGGDLLIDYPPVLLRIILSFVSGAFGALLLTLVLIVYPENGYTASEGAGYGARILLGGLIALCVHVVLQGGSAVLGSDAAATGDANSMAYCAIAILAGMFSDRVAAWLSSRADTFFGTPVAGARARVRV